jgi:hypothetical protein
MVTLPTLSSMKTQPLGMASRHSLLLHGKTLSFMQRQLKFDK